MEVKSNLNGTASGALAPYLRLDYDENGQLAAAGAEAVELGINPSRAHAQGDGLTVIPLNGRCIMRFTASAAITKGDKVYGAAGGKVSSTPNSRYIGKATNTVSGDGSYVDVLVLTDGPSITTVEAKTEDFTLTAADSGKTITTVGATGTVVGTLPAALPGLNFGFRVGAAQELRVDPAGTEKLPTPATGVPGTGGKYLVADADGETLYIECTKAGEWSLKSVVGTWTFEA